MKLYFDKRGNLSPAQIIEVDWIDFKENFEIAFTESLDRKQLFNNFERFITRIKSDISEEFKIWVNGSFVSNKLNPRDIDAVFWIPFSVAESKKSILDNQFFTKNVKNSLKLDLYYSIDYPENHKKNFLTHLDKLYWQDVYGNSRQDHRGFQHQKGFLELKIDKSWKNM
jgi:hypothetical protein